MATSSITYNPSLDVFEQRQIDASVEEISYTETKPQTAIDQQGPHIFEVPASQNPIDLQNVLLNVECKIVKTDGTNIGAAEQVGPINNTLHTLFSQVEVRLGDTSVSYSHSLYPYQAYFEELLYANASELDGRLRMQGFILDEGGNLALPDPETNPHNSGLKKRRDELFALSRKTRLIGRLHCDIFQQDKYLIEHVPLRVTLHRSPDDFCLMKAGGTTYKITISDMSLMIPRVRIGEAMRRSLESRLASGMLAQYNINRTVFHTHMLPTGSLNFHVPNLFRGRLPHTVVLAMVEAANRKPDVAKNPFELKEFELQKIVLSRNNVAVGIHSGLTVDFGDGYNYSNAYLNLLRNTGKMSGGSLISHLHFRRGFAIYPFKVVPQESMYTDASALNEGVLDLMLTFSTATAANLDLFVYAQYNSTITIDKERAVRIDGGS